MTFVSVLLNYIWLDLSFTVIIFGLIGAFWLPCMTTRLAISVMLTGCFFSPVVLAPAITGMCPFSTVIFFLSRSCATAAKRGSFMVVAAAVGRALVVSMVCRVGLRLFFDLGRTLRPLWGRAFRAETLSDDLDLMTAWCYSSSSAASGERPRFCGNKKIY